MAATVSSVWAKPGAWALDSEQHEDELNSQHQLDLSSAAAAAKLPSAPASDFPSLSAAVTTTKPKKKSKQTLSLAEFSNYKPPSGNTSDVVLPTGPRERTAEEIAESRRGGFRNYGGGDRERPRVSREDRDRDRDMGSSRADEAEDWSRAKKVASVGSDRDSGMSRADEVDDWSKGKKFGGERREKMGFFGSSSSSSSRADDVDNWATAKRQTSGRDRKVGFEATGPGADVDTWVKNKDIGSGSGSGRPRLNLQPRTLPVAVVGDVKAVSEGVKAKGNPFGAARPREEVLKDKGQDWKEIDHKLEAVKMNHNTNTNTNTNTTSFDSISRRRVAAPAIDDRTSVSAWRKPLSLSNAPAPTPTPSEETGEKSDEISGGNSEKACEDN